MGAAANGSVGGFCDGPVIVRPRSGRTLNVRHDLAEAVLADKELLKRHWRLYAAQLEFVHGTIGPLP
jgi:hypothetical protein